MTTINDEDNIFLNDPLLNILGSNQLSSQNSDIAERITIEKLDVDRIHKDPNNFYNENDTDEDVELLAGNMVATGCSTKIQPIVVIRMGPSDEQQNEYMIMAGEKRYRAVTEDLKWKTVECVVFPYDTPESVKAAVRHGTNLTTRQYTPEQLFRGYLALARQSEKDNNPALKNYLNISKKRMAQFEKIMNNVKKEDLDKFEKGEVSFSDLKSAVDAQKAEEARQLRINEAYRVYAQKQENAEEKLYINYDKKIIIYVDENQNTYAGQQKTVYGVKEVNYDNRLPSSWVRSRELPNCEDRKTMQLFLDKYAACHGYEETTEEEYLTLIRKKEELFNKDDSSKSKTKQNSDNKKNVAFPPIAVSSDTIDSATSEDMSISSEEKRKLMEQYSDYSEETTSNIDEKKQGNKLSGNSNQANAQEVESAPKNNSEDDVQLNLFKNRYALDLLFEGIDIHTSEKKLGHLVKSKDNRCFILIDKANVDDEMECENDGTLYKLSCIAYEVKPETVFVYSKNNF